MSLAQEGRGTLRPIDGTARAGVGSWLIPVAKALSLAVGAAALAGIAGGVTRADLLIVLICWSLLAVAAAALFASTGSGDHP